MPVRKTLIPPDAEGMKTGLFLRRLFPSLPESVLRKIFAARDVKLDGVRADRDTPVYAGQTLSVFLPASHEESPTLRVIYEDEDVLLVNKPAGISVESDEPGTLSLTDLCRLHTNSRPSSVTDSDRENAGDPGAAFPQPVHRLDNKTCGLCLFAKNERAHTVLLEAFKQRTVEKYYICLVRGIPKPPAATCSAFLLKDAARGVVQILDQNRPGARPITTGYETLSAGPVSRLRVHLITGRTHQIRAHLAALGHPVLGDDLYGDRSFNRLQKSRSLKLCAAELTLHTEGQLPNLDGKTFKINPPF
jgi:23S rRNA pseudouridine955/2504/2580 synthase